MCYRKVPATAGLDQLSSDVRRRVPRAAYRPDSGAGTGRRFELRGEVEPYFTIEHFRENLGIYMSMIVAKKL